MKVFFFGLGLIQSQLNMPIARAKPIKEVLYETLSKPDAPMNSLIDLSSIRNDVMKRNIIPRFLMCSAKNGGSYQYFSLINP